MISWLASRSCMALGRSPQIRARACCMHSLRSWAESSFACEGGPATCTAAAGVEGGRVSLLVVVVVMVILLLLLMLLCVYARWLLSSVILIAYI